MTALRVTSIQPNPDQPRKRFEQQAMAELAASIKENGLIQAISVRDLGNGQYQIIAGERRWRAHALAGLDVIESNIVDVSADERDVLAIVENLQRADITPLEEARAYQRMLDSGYTPESLAQKLGLKQHWRITERTSLLRLRSDYLDLLEKGHLSPSQGFELSRLEQQDQEHLFRMIRDGRCDSYSKLRAAADGILGARSQTSMFGDEDHGPTEQEKAILSRFEKQIEKMVALVSAGFKDGELVVLKKINPHRAGILVQQVGLIGKHLAMIEREVQRVAAQGELHPH